MATDTEVLLVVGSGPRIGVAVASYFAIRKFDRIALISRDIGRLQNDRDKVLEAVRITLEEVKKMGSLGCVVFNPARVGPSEMFGFGKEDIIKDFMTTNIALYTTASWAFPLFAKSQVSRPSFIITTSHLWEFPEPFLFSLSMVKGSQRTLALCLKKAYPDVHVGLRDFGKYILKKRKAGSLKFMYGLKEDVKRLKILGIETQPLPLYAIRVGDPVPASMTDAPVDDANAIICAVTFGSPLSPIRYAANPATCGDAMVRFRKLEL
ncbi:hypothetical protein B7494_g880 [Chlorociboria aeruginascens]|nr:hypothetical protein B7494_g880 [Chlorociboria aeruginascens]